MQTPIKLITKFESGPDAKFKMGFLDDYGAGLLKAAVEESHFELCIGPGFEFGD
jgi:hypothetical protein